MKSEKRARLERAGWRVGDAADFLGLSDEERRVVDLTLARAAGRRQLRDRQDDNDRAALHAALQASDLDVGAERLVDATEVLRDLRTR